MKKTNWDNYYLHPYKASTFTRKITSNKLIRLFKEFLPQNINDIKIAELGGANSCFYLTINKDLCPSKYLIVDNNQVGLNKTIERLKKAHNIELKCEDILKTTEQIEKFDIVFSVGLIEHFSHEGTIQCIASHFHYLKSKGICLITFPTPTWLYRITRMFAELFGIWIFHDERPLKMDEVIKEVKKFGTISHTSITWKIVLTQGVVVVIKD